MAKAKTASGLKRRLYYGDNLEVLRRHIAPESVDLVYLDPPFNSDQDYNVLFRDRGTAKDSAQFSAFEDTWRWSHEAEEAFHDATKSGGPAAKALVSLRGFLGQSDMMAYLSMMGPRLVELHRVMKPTASIYLHCDPNASHYLKMIMDSVFGPANFLNEIIWKRTGSHSPPRRYGPSHDTILVYAKSDHYYFNTVKRPYMRGHVERRYKIDAASGRAKFSSGGNVLTGSGLRTGESGKPWRGIDPSKKNRHWAIPGFLAAAMPPEFKSLGVLAKLDALHEAKLIELTPGSVWPQPVRFLKEDDGQPLQDIWACQPYTNGTVYGTDDCIDADVQWLGPTDPERIGYPTQKPIGLLERIIRVSCPPEGVVMDPFCGCGTTIDAAHRMNRLWIGIDITSIATNVIKHRLMTAFDAKVGMDYEVIGEPADLAGAEQLAKEDTHQFEHWALGLVGARASAKKKGADQGIDGRLYFYDDHGSPKEVIVSVKSGKTSVKDVRDLRGVIEREKATMGVLIALQESTQPMRAEAAAAGVYESPWGGKHPRLQVLTIEKLVDGADIDRPPTKAPAMVRKGTKSIPPPIVTDEPLTLESPTTIATRKPAKAKKKAKPSVDEVVELYRKKPKRRS